MPVVTRNHRFSHVGVPYSIGPTQHCCYALEISCEGRREAVVYKLDACNLAMLSLMWVGCHQLSPALLHDRRCADYNMCSAKSHGSSWAAAGTQCLCDAPSCFAGTNALRSANCHHRHVVPCKCTHNHQVGIQQELFGALICETIELATLNIGFLCG
jgi:hypothetical protein